MVIHAGARGRAEGNEAENRVVGMAYVYLINGKVA